MKDIISKFSANSDNKLVFINGQLSTSSQRTPEQAKEAADYLLKKENSEALQSAFNDLYMEGAASCISFQKDIKNLFKEAGKTEQRINFFKNQTKQWMGNLSEQDKKKPITNLILPGTHDSGAYQIDWNRRADHFNKWWQKALFVVMQLPVIKNIVEKWTVTQKKSIQDQLKAGVRLFDFRIGKDSKGQPCLAHGPFIVEDFEKAIKQINQFITENPKEAVVINSKIESGYQINPEDSEKVRQILKNNLGNRIMPPDTDLHKTSLKTIADKKQNVILFAQGLNDNEANIFRMNSSHEIWPNKTNPKDVVPTIKQELEKGTGKDSTLLYPSLNTTPDTKSVVIDTIKGMLGFEQQKNLKECGKAIQNELPELLDVLKKHKVTDKPQLQGVIMDTPKRANIQKIVASSLQDQ